MKRTLISLATRLRNPMVTDEYFVPRLGLELEPYLQAGNKTGAHHLARYYWAVEVIGKYLSAGRILDVACGSGYGSYLLANAFPNIQVTGADYDRKAVRKANDTYRLANLEYHHGDLTRWDETLGEGWYDVVASFDTLEHIPHREIAMENLVRHLAPAGVLLLSTPCGRDQNLLQPFWPFHKIEYSAASLYDFLRRYFDTLIRREDADFPGSKVFDALANAGITYMPKLNPVICEKPRLFDNPYRQPVNKPEIG